MARKLTSLIAALTIAVTALAPTLAEARDHRGGGYDHGYDRGYYEHRGRGDYRRHDNDDDDALAAGVIGLALGAIIGSAVTSSNQSRQRYYEPAPRAYYPPPPAYYPPPQGYYGEPRYRASPPVCVLRERVWDPYAGQYVRVERRIPC